ncbi:hypothetical protein VTK26DRAFT_1688 [Humicola hyalothermophila]
MAQRWAIRTGGAAKVWDHSRTVATKNHSVTFGAEAESFTDQQPRKSSQRTCQLKTTLFAQPRRFGRLCFFLWSWKKVSRGFPPGRMWHPATSFKQFRCCGREYCSGSHSFPPLPASRCEGQEFFFFFSFRVIETPTPHTHPSLCPCLLSPISTTCPSRGRKLVGCSRHP